MEGHDSLLAVIQNEVVMDNIIGFLSIKDVGSCRLVSQDWCRATTPTFRKTVILTEIEEYLERMEEQNEFDNYESYPFKKFCLGGSFAWNAEKVLNFWKQCGPVMTHLKLSGFGRSYQRCAAINTVSAITKRVDFQVNFENAVAKVPTPHLKALIIEGVQIFEPTSPALSAIYVDNGYKNKVTSLEVTKYSTIDEEPLIKLILLHPGLKTLRLSDLRFRIKYTEHSASSLTYMTYEFLETALESLLRAQETTSKQLSIQNLDIIDVMWDDQEGMKAPFYITMQQLKFPLETLKIDLGVDTKAEVAAGLLGEFKETIQRLVLFRESDSASWDSDIPFHGSQRKFPFELHFNKLKVLKMSSSLIETMDFLKFMPKLRVLHIRARDEELLRLTDFEANGFAANQTKWESNVVTSTDEEIMAEVKMEFLKEFRFDFECFWYDIPKLAKWMPNVEKLSIRLLGDPGEASKTVDEICNRWGRLQDLFMGLREDIGGDPFQRLKEIKNLKWSVLTTEKDSDFSEEDSEDGDNEREDDAGISDDDDEDGSENSNESDDDDRVIDWDDII